ncbi:MAG: GspE/PulE family protein [Candidatus Andersenbacteria bacterium]
MAEFQNKLLDALLQRGLLKVEQVERVAARSDKENKAPEEIILAERLVFPEALAQVQAEILGIPYVDLTKATIDEKAMQDISRKAAITYRFVAFDIKGNDLFVAMENPDDFQAQEAIKFIAKRKGMVPQIYLASAEGIEKALGGSSAVEAEIGGALTDFTQELEDAGRQVSGKEDKDIERVMEEAPVTKVVAVMIRHAIEGHASDIHIEPNERELRVRYRIDGDLHTTLVLPLKVHAAIISRVKILSSLKIDESRLPQDGRFSATVDSRAYDFRVSTMPTTFGEKAALRILDKSSGAPSFEELGLRGESKARFEEGLHSPHGIILISGPTGAGKSTTLFTSLTQLNSPDTNIVTLEDPVEYEVEGVNQTQIHPEIGLSFASGLRSMLRQDPDIIMVGEIRDKETAELAVHASLTGHLVLSTIHTNDAVGTVPRLVDMGIDPFLLAASLRVLAAQRLVGRLCQDCKQEVELSPNMREKIVQDIASIPDQHKETENQKSPKVLYESPGCPVCQERGSIGRLAIFEAIPVSRAFREVMNNDAGYDTLQDIAMREGLITMRQDGILKALNGEVLYEDVMRVTSQDVVSNT